MTKLTAAQIRVLETLKAGARIQRTGYGSDARMTLMMPDPESHGGFDWLESVRDSVISGLLKAGAIKRVGDAYSRDSYWIAA